MEEELVDVEAFLEPGEGKTKSVNNMSKQALFCCANTVVLDSGLDKDGVRMKTGEITRWTTSEFL